MVRFKEFNRKWKAVVREAVERMEKEGLLDIKEKDIVGIDDIDLFINAERLVSCNMMSKSLRVYEIGNDKILTAKADIRGMLKDIIKNILITLTKEKSICYTDTEFNTLLEILVETVIVAIDNRKSYDLPIFRYEVPKLGYIKVYPNYRETINGQNKTRKTLTIEELGKEILGEFRRRMRLKDKWVPMAYELYRKYSCEGFIKEVDLEKRLNLLEEKAELVTRSGMNIKEFIKLFTIIPKEDIDKMSVYELTFIKHSLMQLSSVWRLIRKGENISLTRHIPNYFKVYVKFK